MRKVEVVTTIKLSLVVDDGLEIGDVLEDIEFIAGEGFDVANSEVVSYEVTDSR